MKELKPNNYYNLKYSVIPDNKIRQIIGTYLSTDYADANAERDGTTFSNLRGTGNYTLPCFTNSELETDDNLFADVFHQLSVETYFWTDEEQVYPLPYDTKKWRKESIYADIVINIEDTNPIEYNATVGVSVSNVSGTHRSRIYKSSGIYFVLGWINNFSYDPADNNKVYSVRNFNLSGTGWPASNKETNDYVNIDDAKISSVTVDPYYDGSHTLNDKYLLRLTIKVRVFYGYLHVEWTTNPSQVIGPSTVTDDTSGLEFSMLDKITFNIPYFVQGNGQVVDFEYHTSDSDYRDYPLRIDGNEYTNDKVYFVRHGRNTIWSSWISNEILSMYKNGKMFISAKVKMSWMMNNLISINTPILIKDTNNNYISKIVNGAERVYLFKVKNIEYECNEEGYAANIILLESGLLKQLVEVVDSNNLDVVDSNSIEVMLIQEEDD